MLSLRTPTGGTFLFAETTDAARKARARGLSDTL